MYAAQVQGLATPAVFPRALARYAVPEPVLGVAEWAEERREIAAESGSPRPGKWRNATTPYGVEIMDCLNPEHPARVVTLRCASQLIKSEVALNWIGQTIDTDPAPMMLVLPSLNEIRTWGKTKWEPFLAANPRVARKVREIIARGSEGSTGNFKAFRGGFLQIASAASSKELQSRSVKRIICDEVEEYDLDNGRGDPIDQAITRGDAHADLKVLLASTAGALPDCRISRYYEAGDQRQLYVACLHCGEAQALSIERLSRDDSGRGFLACVGCGAVHTETDKPALLAGAFWLKTYPGDDANPAPPEHFAGAEIAHWRARKSAGRQPSFWLSQAASPFKMWGQLLAEQDAAATGSIESQKTFRQQKLALPWDPSTEAPDHDKLDEAKGLFVQRGIVPAWAVMLTGAADIQNDRIEWVAYAWGPDRSGARIDWGVIWGDTLTDAPWLELSEAVGRRFPGEATVPLGFDRFGVDTGGGVGRTAKAYEFVRLSLRRGRGNVRALKGSSDPKALPLVQGGKGRARTKSGKNRSAPLWLVGASELKREVYARLFRGVNPDDTDGRPEAALFYTADTPEEHFKQLTAEIWREPKSRRAGAIGQWERLAGRANEQLDLAVYSLALAWDAGLEAFGPSEWAKLIAVRAKPSEDAPLLDAARAELGAQAAPQTPPTPAEPGAKPRPRTAANPATNGHWMARLAKLNNQGKPQ